MFSIVTERPIKIQFDPWVIRVSLESIAKQHEEVVLSDGSFLASIPEETHLLNFQTNYKPNRLDVEKLLETSGWTLQEWKICEIFTIPYREWLGLEQEF